MSDRPYAASWLDRLTAAIGRSPVPYPIVYLIIGLAFAFARTAIGWIDGSYPVGTLFAVHVIDGFIPVYFLLAIHLLDDLARRAMSDYRPRLRGGDAEYDELTYRLTTMPFRTSLVVGILALAEGAIYIPLLLSPVDIEASHYLTSPAAVVADTTLSVLAGLLMVTFGYHALRQLWMISRIYTRHTNVSIFDVGGLYALSRVTAMTAVTLLFFTYIYFALYAQGGINSVINAVVVALIVFGALLAFVLPLYGAHRLMVTAKSARLSEIARRIERTADDVQAKTGAGQYTDEIRHIDGALDSLLKVREVVAKAKTWPWEPDAVRVVITAVILPIVIWIATRILERFGI